MVSSSHSFPIHYSHPWTLYVRTYVRRNWRCKLTTKNWQFCYIQSTDSSLWEKHIHIVAVPVNTIDRLQPLEVRSDTAARGLLPRTRPSSMNGMLMRLFRRWVHGWHATPGTETNQHALDDWVLWLHESSHWYHRMDPSNLFNSLLRCTPSIVPSYFWTKW